ncbi:MAG: hypothetical protein QM640_01780 [Niabella sp.]
MTKEVLAVRRVPFYILLVAIGIILGYLAYSIINKQGEFATFVATDPHQIDSTEARQYMDKFKERHPKVAGQYWALTTIQNGKKVLLRGFFINKTIIDSINFLAGKDSLTGYGIYFGRRPSAKDPKLEENTIVIRGVTDKTKKSVSNVENIYYDKVNPCPEDCGGEQL